MTRTSPVRLASTSRNAISSGSNGIVFGGTMGPPVSPTKPPPAPEHAGRGGPGRVTRAGRLPRTLDVVDDAVALQYFARWLGDDEATAKERSVAVVGGAALSISVGELLAAADVGEVETGVLSRRVRKAYNRGIIGPKLLDALQAFNAIALSFADQLRPRPLATKAGELDRLLALLQELGLPEVSLPAPADEEPVAAFVRVIDALVAEVRRKTQTRRGAHEQ